MTPAVATPVAVRLFHAEPGPNAGPLERLLAAARRDLADRHSDGFREAGADVAIVAGPPDDTPFGARLRRLVEQERPAGLVVLGSGAVPLARRSDRRAFVDAAGGRRPTALANNRYSADVLAIPCADRLLELPDLPGDNALPRWLEEVAGYEVRDMRRRRRMQVDLDSPIDLVVAGIDDAGLLERAAGTFRAIAAVAADRRAEVVVTGRTSAATIRWLERKTAARTRAIVEERGLRAATSLAFGGEERSASQHRPPVSLLGRQLDAEGPGALGAILADLGDAAVVDTRVLLAHRHGPDEASWPRPEDRYASDLLDATAIADPWLRELTASAAGAPIPIALGGHTLVGPGLPIVLSRLMAESGSS
ncbi:MAG TPA: hypothetical protein VGQ58_02480 [Candidatus Limnocylindrales bacterium]|jgi:hypothetical protein|nr:hypothetical protein [Candidatus Limnocylindrales bacterium]